MKFIISFLLITKYFQVANSGLSRSLLYELSTAVFDDELNAFLEDIKPILKTGNESLGIPMLEPYQLEYYNISTTQSDASIEGNVSDVNIDGLSNYAVNHAKFRYTLMQLKLNLTWPNITLNSMYRVNAEVKKWGYFPVYGKGHVRLEATNVTVTAMMKMGLKSGKISVREMNTSFHLKDIKFVASGIYDNKGVSQLANAVVSSQLPFFVEFYQRVFNMKVTPIIKELINQQLAELTFEDFINIIG